MSQSDIYTILCIVVGEDVPFYIDIGKSKTVDWLKVLIKEKKSNFFADIDPNFLDLYHVDIANDDELVVKVKAYPLDDSKLPATTALANVFPATPKGDTVYFIVNPNVPLQKSTSSEFVSYVDAVKFFTKALGNWTLEDLMDDSNNTHLHVAPGVVSSPLRPGPPYLDDQRISVYVQKLDAKRSVSQVQLQTLKKTFDQATCEAHFETSDDKELSASELDNYTMYLQSHHRRVEGVRRTSATFRRDHMTVYLVDGALLGDFCGYDKSIALDPLLLQGKLADRESLYTFKPPIPFCCFHATYGPLIIGEVMSEERVSERWKMLFEGIAACRYQNMLRQSREAIVLCLYLNKDYMMERYLVYQAAEGDTRDVHVLHDLTLDLSEVQDTFLLAKQLFNFRDHLVQIPKIDDSRKRELLEVENQIKERYPISVMTARRGKKRERVPSRKPARILGSISEDAVLQVSFKAIYPVNFMERDVARAIRRSDMQPVVLKRIRTDSSELHILRLLQSYTSQDPDHIVPLLDVIQRPPGISALVMPLYTPIFDLSECPLEKLALQLIRGVDWLHTKLISHCDIKQKNLVFDEKRNRLLIIDFELAVELISREETIQGGRGTPEHVAPEVGVESSYENCLEEIFVRDDSIYSPILADVWAVGDVINGLQELFDSSTGSIGTVMEQVAKELRVDDPTERLSLHDAEGRIAAACSTAATA